MDVVVSLSPLVVYYCRTYVKAVPRGGGSEERGRVLWGLRT